MAKKKQKKHKKEKEQRKKSKVKEFTIETSKMQSDVKTFIDKFKSDVAKKRKTYQSSAQKLRKKKF